MSDTLLRSLLSQVLDEEQSLAGLLRKCLALGAETGSESLRQWARSELNGYGDETVVPAYRVVPTPPISVDFTSGYNWVKGQIVDRLQLPAEAQKGVPEQFAFRQPIEELEQLSQIKSVTFTNTGLAYAQAVWNEESDWRQQITSLSYKIAGSTIAGMVGSVRTQLVDLVAELCADTPLTELPKKEQVDAAVRQYVGNQYNTTIQSATGPTAIGTHASSAVGVELNEVFAMLDALKAIVTNEPVEDEAASDELIAAIEDLRQEISRGSQAIPAR